MSYLYSAYTYMDHQGARVNDEVLDEDNTDFAAMRDLLASALADHKPFHADDPEVDIDWAAETIAAVSVSDFDDPEQVDQLEGRRVFRIDAGRARSGAHLVYELVRREDRTGDMKR